MTMKGDFYSYRVIYSAEDGEFVGLCTELPSLSWLAGSHQAALRGIRRVVAGVIKDLQASGEPVPEPLSTKRFSGKFQVRIPSEEHRRLAREAAEQGISLNRLVSARLARPGSGT
jgi:predicted HicB family RNase H-like nuclease